MAKTIQQVGYGIYWFTWALLLAFTLLMLATGYVTLPRLFVLLFLLLVMLAKASLIGAHFMHLRFEKLALVLTVVIAILATATFLFALIAFDGLRILKLSSP